MCRSSTADQPDLCMPPFLLCCAEPAPQSRSLRIVLASALHRPAGRPTISMCQLLFPALRPHTGHSPPPRHTSGLCLGRWAALSTLTDTQTGLSPCAFLLPQGGSATSILEPEPLRLVSLAMPEKDGKHFLLRMRAAEFGGWIMLFCRSVGRRLDIIPAAAPSSLLPA